MGTDPRPVAGQEAESTAMALAEVALRRLLGGQAGLAPEVRAEQRTLLEALAVDLYPPHPPGGQPSLSRRLLLPAVAALLLLPLLRALPWSRSFRAPEPPTLASAPRTRTAADNSTSQPHRLLRLGPAAKSGSTAISSPRPVLQTPTPVSGSPHSGMPAGPARAANRSGPTPRGGILQGASEPEQPPTAIGSTSHEDGSPPLGVVPPPPGPRAEVPCQGNGALAPGAGDGHRVYGQVVDDRCRPLADILVAFSRRSDGTETLTRTEADGSYLALLEAGTYEPDLLVAGPWRAWLEDLPADGSLTLRGLRGDLRLDFVWRGAPR